MTQKLDTAQVIAALLVVLALSAHCASGTRKIKRQTTCTEDNEEFLTCGPRCPENCPPSELELCPEESCTVGCFCKEGYVRFFGHRCIEKSECPF
ncbi:cysteine-rich venom protein 1-like [Anopheles bellator]|uniref:cysteine-rich venom protein 1-like n=1 Tax=Anopheles bellator TaxID=139047 RepID=UPI00264980E9|nr:cysteine-rich venom protein 1-like [Anopheles bellator]